MIRITARRDGFRRAGIAHSTTPTDYANDFFTPEQLAALRADPMLRVEDVEDGEASGKAPAKAKNAKK